MKVGPRFSLLPFPAAKIDCLVRSSWYKAHVTSCDTRLRLPPLRLSLHHLRHERMDVVAAGTLALLSLLWSLLAIIHSPELSRLDEWTYLDYAWKVSAGHIPVAGEPVAREILVAWSCRGMDGTIQGVTLPTCSVANGADVSAWPYKGQNYNAFHPPVYFLLMGLFARAVSVSGMSFVTGARLFCGLVVAVSLSALYFAIRRWCVGRVAAFSATLLTLATPGVAASAAIAHSESINVLAGACAVWLGARIVVDRNFGWKVPAIVAVAVASMRVISTVGLLALALAEILFAIFPRISGMAVSRIERRRLAGIGIAIVAGVMATYLAWALWQGIRTHASYVPATKGVSTSEFGNSDIGRVLRTLISVYGLSQYPQDWYMQLSLNSTVLVAWSTALYCFYLALPWVALAVSFKERTKRTLAASAAAGPLVAGVVVQAREIVTNASFFRNISGRYALSALPLFAASAAFVCDRKWMRSGLCVIASLGYAIVMISPLLADLPS